MMIYINVGYIRYVVMAEGGLIGRIEWNLAGELVKYRLRCLQLCLLGVCCCLCCGCCGYLHNYYQTGYY